MASAASPSMSLAQVLSAPHALAVLGLPVSSLLSDTDVRAAYRAAALRWHPDKMTSAQQADAELVQQHGHAFVRVCEAFQAVQDAHARGKLIASLREEELRREMAVQQAQDAAAAAAQQRAASHTQPRATPAAAFPPSAVRRTPQASASRASPMGHARSTASTSASAASRAFSISAAPAVSTVRQTSNTGTRAGRASAAAQRASAAVSIPAADSPEFLAALTRWKQHFSAEMDAERARASHALVERFGGAHASAALQAQVGSVFTQAAPARTSSADALALASSAPAVSAAPSRLQQMRDRQRGVHTAVVPASTAVAVPAPPVTALSREHAALLTAGDRFRMRTVASSAAAASLSAGRRSVSGPALSALPPSIAAGSPVPISLWVDAGLSLLQFRLVSSPHSHPDGVIPLANVSDVRRLSKPAGGCWLSVVQRDGSCLSVEASSTELRDRWMSALLAASRSARA